ncbi:MAG: hypothetical protein FWC73_07130 [Defluviitaleaceae bacterium]|nr:hypothetical protein [Defluviitaleaceae bacterium]
MVLTSGEVGYHGMMGFILYRLGVEGVTMKTKSQQTHESTGFADGG